MKYSVIVKPNASKDLDLLPKYIYLNIRNVLNSLREESRPVGCKKLIGSENRWRIRIGNYRILYEINDDLKTVEIFRIAHRKDVYR